MNLKLNAELRKLIVLTIMMMFFFCFIPHYIEAVLKLIHFGVFLTLLKSRKREHVQHK